MKEQEMKLGGPFIEDDDEYHAHTKEKRTIASTALKVFRGSPADYEARFILNIDKQTESPAMYFGKAAHCLILEGPEAFDHRFKLLDEQTAEEIGVINKKTGKPYGQDTAAFKKGMAGFKEKFGGRQPLLPDEYEMLVNMTKAVNQNEVANDLLNIRNGMPEAVFRYFSESLNITLQCKADRLLLNDDGTNIRGFVDLKTCQCLHEFKRKARIFQYPQQMCFYRETIERVCKAEQSTLQLDAMDVFLVAVEKRVPFKVGVWCFPTLVLDELGDDLTEELCRYSACLKTNNWPTGFEGVQEWE